MLKMIVVPIIFFSLVVGAASLPIKKFGRVGLKVIGWYLFTSILAAILGVVIALIVSPGAGTQLGQWQEKAAPFSKKASEIIGQAGSTATFRDLILDMFKNPFEALAGGRFLAIIVFSILFGLAIRVCIEKSKDEKQIKQLERLEEIFKACGDAMTKVVDWILEYSPVGVLVLTIVNFYSFGPGLARHYLSITGGVIFGILLMIFGAYSILLFLITGQNPLSFFKRIKEVMIMAFTTRSSAATLPVSIKTATKQLKIHNELVGFSLPLGATINMDGVCVHLPMFAVLASNLFGIELTAGKLILLVITTVLASIGAGGVPGGSLMLMLIVLETLGCNSQQIAIIVALALGINPVLDMFETMNNVTGDIVCTYVVAHNEGLLGTETA
jgi:Na+/H+-dicarboxylate symporter